MHAPYRWEDNIKMYVKDVGWEGMDWIDVAEDGDKWQDFKMQYRTWRILKMWWISWIVDGL